MGPCDNFFREGLPPCPERQGDRAGAPMEPKIWRRGKTRQLLVETHPGMAQASPSAVAMGHGNWAAKVRSPAMSRGCDDGG